MTTSKAMKSAPVSHLRCPVYQASKTGTEVTTARITSERHGIAWTVTGRLGQAHASIRNILLSGEYEQIEMIDGAVLVLCDVYGVLRRLGYQSPGRDSARWLFKRIDEMRQAQLIEDRAGVVTTVGIVSKHAYSKKADRQGRHKYAVVFSAEYVRLVKSGYAVHFSPAQARALAQMPAVASAAVQYLVTHKIDAQYALDTVLDSIGVSGSRSKMSKDRQKIRAAVAVSGPLFGLDMLNDNVVRRVPNVSAHADAVRARVSAHADARSAHADAVSTHADAVSTHADAPIVFIGPNRGL